MMTPQLSNSRVLAAADDDAIVVFMVALEEVCLQYENMRAPNLVIVHALLV